MSDSNATPSIFGWQFQCNAAIIIMLNDIQNAYAVRVEGETEDIEVYLNDGTTIYSQAKAVQDIENSKNVLAKLKEGMRTLSNATNRTDINRLIYVTNSPNPFNSQKTMAYFYGLTRLKYKELPPECKKKIDKIIEGYDKKDILTSFLEINTIPFYGDYDDK